MVKQGEQKLFYKDFGGLEKVTIIPFETHWGSKGFDKELFLKHVDWVGESDNTYALFVGDNIECATRDSVGAGVFEQEEIVDEQVDGFVEAVKPLADEGKVLGLHTGNHEWRVYKHSGLDIAKQMAKMLGVTYFGWTIHHLWKVGAQNYTAMSMHGSSGSRLPHTKIKAVLDRQNMSDVEVYIMGHLHQLSHHTRTFYMIDKRIRTVKEGEKHFLLCGSYLNHWGGYAEQAGYEMMRKGSPKVKLSGLEHRIKISL